MIICALTPGGVKLAINIARKINQTQIYLPVKLKNLIFENNYILFFDDFDEIIKNAFEKKIPLVFIMATGIVVRKICPCLMGKEKDPPVIVMDEKGKFVISLISGHLGGANELAKKISVITGGEAVITTATDVNSLPAIDNIAKKNNLIIENIDAIKVINYAILTDNKINLVDIGRVIEESDKNFIKTDFKTALTSALPTVYISFYMPFDKSDKIPANWLFLRPKNLIIGVGCNRCASKNEIIDFIYEIFSKHRLSLLSLKKIASIDAKMDETGIIDTAKQFGVNIEWYSKERLSGVKVPNPSETVMKNMGTPTVSEAAALIASKNTRLLVTKQKKGNVTIAVAREAYQS